MNNENTMKEMTYSSNGIKTCTLFEGDYMGHHFYIRSIRGKYPTAYVSEHIRIDNIADFIHCHGGITYHTTSYWNYNDNQTYIGWDYGHIGDWVAFQTDDENIKDNNKKWTTEEIFEEVKNVIHQMVKMGL